jgi:cyclopropane fatty-acyl-phospholipid synthase-like methyltransferase
MIDRFMKRFRRSGKSWDHRFSATTAVPPWRGRTSLDVHERALDSGWIASHSDILDVGSGEGTLTLRLAERTNGRIHGIDISNLAIDLAQKGAQLANFSHRLTYEVVDLFDSEGFIKKNRSRFDLAVDVGCFHNFKKEKDEIFITKLMAEVLKPNGKWLLAMRAFRDDSKTSRREEEQQLTDHLRAVTAELFHLEQVQKCDLTGPNSPKEMPGLAFFFVKI